MPPLAFYVGLHQPSDARHFERCCIAVSRLRYRRTVQLRRWIMDSGAFTEVARHGGYRAGVAAYAEEARRWTGFGQLEAIVAQDFMCEPFVLRRTGLSTGRKPCRTGMTGTSGSQSSRASYRSIVRRWCSATEYRRHVAAYGDRLADGAWVGVGSVCRRNSSPADIVAVLGAIKAERPDLRLHGFGVKITALGDPSVRAMLASADSMAWSYHARRNGRSANDWREAARMVARVEAGTIETAWQMPLPLEAA